MAYNTKHTLSLINGSHAIIRDLIDNNEEAAFALNTDGSCKQESSWYRSEDDLLEFSTLYPGVVFVLTGDGEDSVDNWRLYVKNGAKQQVLGTVTFEEYDESKLE